MIRPHAQAQPVQPDRKFPCCTSPLPSLQACSPWSHPGGATLTTSSNPNCLPETPPASLITLGVMASAYKCGGHRHSVPDRCRMPPPASRSHRSHSLWQEQRGQGSRGNESLLSKTRSRRVPWLCSRGGLLPGKGQGPTMGLCVGPGLAVAGAKEGSRPMRAATGQAGVLRDSPLPSPSSLACGTVS